MSIRIRITDKTGKQLTDSSFNNDNLMNANPLELMSKMIENGDLEIMSYNSTFNTLTGICETEINLRDTTPSINYNLYLHKQELICEAMDKKTKEEKRGCYNCEYHYYDRLFGDDDEYELCEKGHDPPMRDCDDWKEL